MQSLWRCHIILSLQYNTAEEMVNRMNHMSMQDTYNAINNNYSYNNNNAMGAMGAYKTMSGHPGPHSGMGHGHHSANSAQMWRTPRATGSLTQIDRANQVQDLNDGVNSLWHSDTI